MFLTIHKKNKLYILLISRQTLSQKLIIYSLNWFLEKPSLVQAFLLCVVCILIVIRFSQIMVRIPFDDHDSHHCILEIKHRHHSRYLNSCRYILYNNTRIVKIFISSVKRKREIVTLSPQNRPYRYFTVRGSFVMK